MGACRGSWFRHLRRTVAFRVPGGAGPQAQFTYDLAVYGRGNRQPWFASLPVVEVAPGATYHYQAEAADADGDPLDLRLEAGPAGMHWSAEARRLEWSPTAAQIGNHVVILRAEDPYGGWVEQRFLLAVADPVGNRPPRIDSLPETVAYVGATDSDLVTVSVRLMHYRRQYAKEEDERICVGEGWPLLAVDRGPTVLSIFEHIGPLVSCLSRVC